MKEIVIDGARINDTETLFDEINRVFTRDFSGFNRTLDGFVDLLWGGFGLHEYGEPILVRWNSSDKSRAALGELFNEIQEMLDEHPNATVDFK